MNEPADLMPDLRVALGSAEALASIESDWRRLEATIRPRFFLSWTWIGTWLESATVPVITARVYREDALVAIGLFGLSTERRHGLLRSRVAHLHQSGRVEEDQPWIEYNGLLAGGADQHAALSAVIATLLEEDRCDEVHLSMLADPKTGGVTSESLASYNPAGAVE